MAKSPKKISKRQLYLQIRQSNYYLKIFLMAVFLFLLMAFITYRFVQRTHLSSIKKDLSASQIRLKTKKQEDEEKGSFTVQDPDRVEAAPRKNTYQIQKGDSLWTISLKVYGDPMLWPKLYQANKGTVGKNPDLIYPGYILNTPEQL